MKATEEFWLASQAPADAPRMDTLDTLTKRNWIGALDLPLDLNGLGVWDRTFDHDAFSAASPVARLRELAAQQPDRPALDDGVSRLTFGELWSACRRLAHAIQTEAPGDGPVGVLLSATTMYPMAVFACLAAGRICVPFDRGRPHAFNAAIAADARLSAVILAGADASDPAMATLGARAIVLETALLGRESSDCQLAPDPDRPGFLIFTSGSTGRPKGVVLSQGDMMHRAGSLIAAMHLDERDRLLCLGPQNTVGTVVYNMTLLSGLTLHVHDIAQGGFGAMLEVVHANRITVLSGAVSLLKTLIGLDGSGEAMANLRRLSPFGEPLLHVDLAWMRAILPHDCRITTVLGMTESYFAQWFVPEHDSHDPVRVASGYVLPGYEIQFLNEAGEACAPGEAGELVLRGRCVALGDWLDGKLVPGRFLPDPSDPRKRIFRTGDIVRQAPDGVLVVLGRKDRMVKINGQRVEPAMTEAALRGHPAVRDAVVLPQARGQAVRLVAFVMPRAGWNEGLVASLRAELARLLPSYMRPAAIIPREAFPLLPGGKVDGMALLADLEAKANVTALAAHALASERSG